MIGKRIKEIRAYFHLNLKDFSEKLKYSASQISMVENSKANPSESLLLLISQVFKISEPWLLDGKGSMFNESFEAREVVAPYGNNPRSFNSCQMAMVKAQKAGLNEEELSRMEAIIAKITDLLTTEDRKERERYATVIYGMIALCQPALSQQGGRENGESSYPLEREKE